MPYAIPKDIVLLAQTIPCAVTRHYTEPCCAQTHYAVPYAVSYAVPKIDEGAACKSLSLACCCR